MDSSRAKIADDGGLTIPAEYREALGLAIGAEVILSLDDDQIRIFTVDTAIRRAQDIVSWCVDPQRSLVDELLADRRAEAESE